MAVRRIGVPGLERNLGTGKNIRGGEGYFAGGYRIVLFRRSGPIQIQGTITVEYLMLGGGGSGAGGAATRGYGGGGAGGYLTGSITLSNMRGDVVVGEGGRNTTDPGWGSDVASWGYPGTDSWFLNILRAYGGGLGATGSNNGGNGGSGGGGGNGATTTSGGTATAGQGNNGAGSTGTGTSGGPGGGGGGAAGAGSGTSGGAAATSTFLGYSDTFGKGGDGAPTSSDPAGAMTPLAPNRGHGSFSRGGSNSLQSQRGSDGLVALRYAA